MQFAICNEALVIFVMSVMLPVEANISIHVKDTGGTGKPILFVHGWPLDNRIFEYQYIALKAKDYRCHWFGSSRLWYVRKAMARLQL